MAFIEQDAVLNHLRKKYGDYVSTTDFGHSKQVTCEKYGKKFTGMGDTWDEALAWLEERVENERSKHSGI